MGDCCGDCVLVTITSWRYWSEKGVGAGCTPPPVKSLVDNSVVGMRFFFFLIGTLPFPHTRSSVTDNCDESSDCMSRTNSKRARRWRRPFKVLSLGPPGFYSGCGQYAILNSVLFLSWPLGFEHISPALFTIHQLFHLLNHHLLSISWGQV